MEVPELHELFSVCGTNGAMREEPYFSSPSILGVKIAFAVTLCLMQHTFSPLFMPNSERNWNHSILAKRRLGGLPQLHQ
jgi:hypothetical protein